MTKLQWDAMERFYHTGIDRGVLYLPDDSGVVWNGLTQLQETNSSSDQSPSYQDGERYRFTQSLGDYAASLSAYSYPLELDEIKYFSLSYRTMVGQDDYLIHIIYNVLAQTSAGDFQSLSTSENLVDFNWDLTATPIQIPNARASAHFIIDTRIAYPSTVAQVEEILYGTEDTIARLPTIQEISDIFEENSILRIYDNGDGTWTATGPDDVITMIDSTTFNITWDSAIYLSPDTYQISSM